MDRPLYALLAAVPAVAATIFLVASLVYPHPHLGPAIASLAALMLLAGVLEQAVERRLPPGPCGVPAGPRCSAKSPSDPSSPRTPASTNPMQLSSTLAASPVPRSSIGQLA